MCYSQVAPVQEAPVRVPSDLPHGFVSLHELKALPLLGHWPLLEDGMPGWLPFQCLVAMARRIEEGDDGAHVWMELYRRAAQGDRDAQREMGRACELGEFGTPVDPQRAFFWYHRAGLGGDHEARRDAERLMAGASICAAASERPALVYAGSWRITRCQSPREIATHAFHFAECGSISTRVEGREVADVGRWRYDRERLMLELSLAPSQPASAAQAWDIQLLACKDPLLFGRDQKRVSCILERVAGNA